jgi:hypothetical protein
MKKENIALSIFLVFIVGAGAYYSSIKTQNVVETNPPIVPTEPEKVAKTNPPATTPKQSGVIDEHLTINNELRDVNFCGKTYKVKQVMIDGVDVAQRIAYLATNNLIPSTFEKGPRITEQEKAEGKMITQEGTIAKQICGNVQINTTTQTIEVTVGKKFSGQDVGLESETFYHVWIEQSARVALPSGDLYIDDGFSGTLIGPIGNLR